MNFLSALFGSPVPTITAAQLNEKLVRGEKILVLDVREPAEFASGHIKESVLIPLGELNRRANELPKDRPVICVCASGSRSLNATRYLISHGVDAANMSRGMIGWQSARLPIVRANRNSSIH